MTTTPVPHQSIHFGTRREFDIRPVDFQTGKRVPVSTEEMKECECCGRKIVHCFEDISPKGETFILGQECHWFLVQPVCRRGVNNKKATALLGTYA